MLAIDQNSREENNIKGYLFRRKWVLIFSLSVMVITTIPYFLGYWVENNDPQAAWRFTGFVFGVEDGNSYIAKALTGMTGDWLFRTPYTVIPQKGVIAFLPYLMLGKLVAPPGVHEQLVALFHIFRFLAGILMILATYDFINYFIGDERLSKFGLVLAVLGGGVGWIGLLFGKSALLGSLPLEFYSPEAFGFLSLYGIPHLALARAFLLWGFLLHFKFAAEPHNLDYRKFLIIGLLWLGVALLQPLTAVTMGMVLGLHLILIVVQNVKSIKPLVIENGREVAHYFKIFLYEIVLVLPYFIYYLAAYINDEFLKEWSAQNIITSPHPLHFLMAYIAVLPLVILGFISTIKQRHIEKYILICWLILSFALAYSPVTVQRRLIEGIWVVMVVLMLSGYQWLRLSRPDKKWGWCLPLIGMIAIPSTCILLAGGGMTALTPMQPVFRPAAEIGSFEFLGSYAQPKDVVMASYETGNAMPAWAPIRVLVGHGPESADFEKFKNIVESFYDGSQDDTERQMIVDEYHVRFVYWGPDERKLGDWNPSQSTWLTQVFDYNGYAVYERVRQ